MLELATTIAIILAVAVVAILAYASTRPDTFSVQRTLRIKAPAERIFPLIDSPRAMNRWSPFIAPDPAIKIDYLGPENGTGAAHTWSGNRQVGAGRYEIVESIAPTRTVAKLDMRTPIEAHNTVEFTLSPQGNETSVTWAMSGRQPLMAKVASVFIDCDKMVGGPFEQGLANLRAIVET